MGQTTLSESLRAVEAEIAAGRPDRAMALGFEIQSRYPRALAVQRVIGEIYLAQRKTREAIGALDRALAGNPEDARACCARAIVQQIHGNSMAALDWYRRACDINPDDQVLRSAYRELASHLGQPPYQPTRMGLARLYLRGDLFPHAVREFESLLAEQPDSLEAQVGLAETLWRAQRTQAAEERCRRILLNAPSCLKATLILTAIELDAGHAD
ncbi:MAG: tetratricopeptide repeat protein [Ktedonobacterales bacterium]